MKQKLANLLKRFLPLLFGVAVLAYLFAYQIQLEDVAVQATVVERQGVRLVVELEEGRKTIPAHEFAPVQSPEQGVWHKPGVLTVARKVESSMLWMALGLGGVGFAAGALRLQYLVQLLGYRLNFLRAIIYTLIGQLYNSAIPGGTVGGDAVKALYLAGHTQRRAHAFAAVLIDRICGLFTLGTLALVVLLPDIGEESMRAAAFVIVGFLAAGSTAVTLMLSRRVRRLFPENAVSRLPFREALNAFDEAVQVYRGRMGGILTALALSVLPQLGWITMHVALGDGLNITAIGWYDYFVLVPVSGMVAALPISFGGWGVGEAATMYFFGLRGVAAEPAFVLSALGRLIQLAWALAALPVSFFLPRPSAVAARLEQEALSAHPG
ncbi:UPF0104 family protein [bacterium]|nr:MAG: UPF0104 family protein [bacterium]RIK65030.1 MAG: hypothetical protein DCC64_02875 [Planctomycetota bacterium]